MRTCYRLRSNETGDRMKTCIGLVVPLFLAACFGQGEDKAAQDARDIAAVKAAQNAKPPAKPITPQPIVYFDIVSNKFYGSGCNFVAVDGGMGAALLAQEERGIIKLYDKPVVLAADKGSTKLPQGAWSHYVGKEYALTLTKIEGGKATRNGLVDMFDAQLTITDPHDQVVYNSKGTAQCKPM